MTIIGNWKRTSRLNLHGLTLLMKEGTLDQGLKSDLAINRTEQQSRFNEAAIARLRFKAPLRCINSYYPFIKLIESQYYMK